MSWNNCVVRPYKKGEEKYVADVHERVYLEEYNWGTAFGDYAKKIAYDFAVAPKNPREEMWVADINGKLVGCIMLSETENPEVGQLRLFLVEKEYRKKGVGLALTGVFMKKVHECRYQSIILWTADVLAAARRHYGKVGFKLVESVPNDTWSLSGQKVNEEKWEMQIHR